MIGILTICIVAVSFGESIQCTSRTNIYRDVRVWVTKPDAILQSLMQTCPTTLLLNPN